MVLLTSRLKPRELKELSQPRLKDITSEEVERIIDSIKSLGFYGSTVSGISVSVFDNKMVPEKDELITEAEKKVTGVQADYRKDLSQSTKEKDFQTIFGLQLRIRLRI